MWYVSWWFACNRSFSLFHWSCKNNRWLVSRQGRRRSSQQPVSASWERSTCRVFLIHLGAVGNHRSHHRPGTLGSSWSCRVRSWSTCCRLSMRGTIWGLRRCPRGWRNWIHFRGELQSNSCSVCCQCTPCNSRASFWSRHWLIEAGFPILGKICLCPSSLSNACSHLEL